MQISEYIKHDLGSNSLMRRINFHPQNIKQDWDNEIEKNVYVLRGFQEGVQFSCPWDSC